MTSPGQHGYPSQPARRSVDKQTLVPGAARRWPGGAAAHPCSCTRHLRTRGGHATADVSGRAVIVDGDTIEVAGERVRLHGIDAPESRQLCSVGGSDWRCGESAALALEHEAGDRTIVCKGNERDRYGRIIAVCFAGAKDYENLADTLLAFITLASIQFAVRRLARG
jgi:endonuclease YncB( thermonuclease family)